MKRVSLTLLILILLMMFTQSSAMADYDVILDEAFAKGSAVFNNKMTQTALAEHLGVTQAMVSKYESGDYNISLKAAFELFEKLGLRFSCTIEK